MHIERTLRIVAMDRNNSLLVSVSGMCLQEKKGATIIWYSKQFQNKVLEDTIMIDTESC